MWRWSLRFFRIARLTAFDHNPLERPVFEYDLVPLISSRDTMYVAGRFPLLQLAFENQIVCFVEAVVCPRS